jgi:GrpB-like predicted nucleotidyltransferase (UPF0157 family)
MKKKITPLQKKNIALGDALVAQDKPKATKIYKEIKKSLSEGDRREVEKQIKQIKGKAKK